MRLIINIKKFIIIFNVVKINLKFNLRSNKYD